MLVTELNNIQIEPIFISDETNSFEGAFRRAIWPILMIGQMFGVMPVVGISSQSLSDLHFKLKSLRTIYAGIVAIISSNYCLFLFWKIFTDSETFNISEYHSWETHIFLFTSPVLTKTISMRLLHYRENYREVHVSYRLIALH